MGAWNIFRILGDLLHMLSKGILIFAIHRNRSAEGVSLITQGLYAVVFCTRYLDLFREQSAWNAIFKVTYIVTSFYILAVMQWLFPRSREREISWKLGAIVLGASLALSPFAMLIFESRSRWGFLTWMWVFSEILESVCVLPQLLLLRQTTVPTVIDSFYLLALGSYRAFYCINWFVRELDVNDRPPDTVAVIFGIIQTALYIDFAWVYYTRQRVKLRGGGVVDADDLHRGWFLHRIFGKSVPAADDEEAGLGGDGSRGGRARWGSRGISVSADDGVLDSGRDGDDHHEGLDPDARMHDPDELAKAMDDDDDDEDTPLRAGQSSSQSHNNNNNNTTTPPGIRSGDEWDD